MLRHPLERAPLSAEELARLDHLPAGQIAEALRCLARAASAAQHQESVTPGGADRWWDVGRRIARLADRARRLAAGG